MRQPQVEEAIRRILRQRRTDVAGPCPDANELAAFLEAQLTPEETVRFEEHAADCAACQEALALALKLDPVEESAAAPAVAESRGFAYRSSPLRLIFGAAVVVVVGVLLFQATRQSTQPMQKPQMASGQNRQNISGGAGAAMSSNEAKTSVPAAPAVSVGLVADSVTGRPAPIRGGQQARKPPAVTAPAPVENQQATETANLPRPEPPAYANARKLAAGENLKTNLPQNALLNADNRALQMEIAASRPLEAKAKAETLGQPSGQVAQQVPVPIQQAAIANQQAALDQVQTVIAQAGRGGGGMAAQAMEEKKRAELDQKTQASQQAQLAKTAALSVDKKMLAMRSMITDTKGSRVSLALEEARPLLAKDPAGKNAKKIGGRLWYRTSNYWVDSGCVAHGDAPALELARDSKVYADILAREPDLAELHSAGVPILLFWNGSNYLIR